MSWKIAAVRRVLLGSAVLAASPSLAAPPEVASPPPLAAYGELPGVEGMAMAPTGGDLAIVARINGGRRLLVLDREHKLRTTAALEDLKMRGLRWAGDQQVLVTLSNTQTLGPDFTEAKHEFYGNVIVPADGGKTEMVFGRSNNLARTTFGDYGARLVDGKWLGYYGGIEYRLSADRIHYEFDHGRPALFSVDLKSNSPRRVAPSPGQSFWRDWLVDEQGRVAATLDINKTDGHWTIDNARGSQLVAGVDLTADVSLISFNQDGTGVIYRLEDDKIGRSQWFEVPLAGGGAKEVFADEDFRRIYVDPANGRLLGFLREGAEPQPVLFDPAKQAVLRKVYRAFPKLKVSIVEWTPDFGHVLVHTSGNGDSGSWYMVDMAHLRADVVGNDYPTIAPEQVGQISTVAYKAADGLDLDGILTLPPGKEAKNLPLIMMPHGGPQARDDESFDWWAQAFASRGYAVFQPNFRGSTNRDDAFRRAGYGQWGRKMQTDLSDGLAELVKRGVVDPKRACIVGASYGGYAALAGVTLQNGLYRCAVAVAPVSDLTDMYWSDYRESGDNKIVKLSLQESLGDPKTFAEVSPRRKAARADAPILLIHGKDDTVVSFKQSEAMADALRDAGKPYEFVVLKQEDHWLSRSVTRQQMLEAAVAFVQKNNPAN
jgi:dipeptidyl aminopeptidase/acylaminoacyl peptidase